MTHQSLVFLLLVIDQAYDLQVLPAYSRAGGTAVLRCLTPPFVKRDLEVSEWIAQPGHRVLRPADAWAGANHSVFPDSGELHLRNVSRDHGGGESSYRCLAKHRLTGAKTVSAMAGR